MCYIDLPNVPPNYCHLQYIYLLQLQDVVTQADIDEHCGGAGALKGMGVLVILLMAVLAVLVH